MSNTQDLDRLVYALRAGAIKPERLVEAAAAWPANGQGFLRYLADGGFLDRKRMAAIEPATGTFAVEPTADWLDPHRSTAPLGADSPGPTATPSSNDDHDDDSSNGTPDTRYRLLRIYRTGGLGQVWLARDQVLGREVALKMIRPDRVGDPGTRGRFIREARVTGRLEHPGIVPVYDLIDPVDGQPYYAMRLIAGRTLAEAIADYHRLRTEGSGGRLDFIAVLDAFLAVCRAIAFAHSRNILHRDLKGQNVALGDYGEVFVLDWGLAKEVESNAAAAPLSDAGPAPSRGIVGTPAYMSPEVAAGLPASKASDIYGLGAILYTILAGKVPYDGSTPEEVLSKVTQAGPEAPREANPLAPAALEAICSKAMAREPGSRYATADDLAGDVRRWMADEPVGVFRDPWTIRAVRWARRHRTPVAAGIVFLITAVVALAVGAGLLYREQSRTEGEWRRAQREQERAERNFETARTLVLDMGRHIEPFETGMAKGQKSDLDRRAALAAALASFERLQKEQPDDLPVLKQSAALHRYAANISRLLNDLSAAEKAYTSSIDLLDEIGKREPGDASIQDVLAQTLSDYATSQKRAGRLKDAATTLARAEKLAADLKGKVPPSHYQRTFGKLSLDLANVEYRTGRFADADTAARRAIELLDALKTAPVELANPVDELLVAIAVGQWAMILLELGKEAEALKAHDDAVSRFEALGGAKGSRDVRQGACRVRVGRAAAWARIPAKRADAIEDMDRVIEWSQKLSGEFPNAAIHKEVLVGALLQRGECTIATNRPAQAAADFDRALALTRNLVDQFGQQPDHVGLRGRAYLDLGRLSLAEGKKAEAEKRLAFAVQVYQIARDKDPDNVLLRRGHEEVQREQKALKP